MSNYSYIRIRVFQKSSMPRRISEFEYVLKQAVQRTLDDRWQVKLAPWEDGGPTWVVFLPGTACDQPEANKRLLAPGEDVGFPVTVQPHAIAFRHSINMFTGWAQGRVAEQLADHFRVGVFFDATDETRKPGTKVYRVGKTFKDYLTHNFKKPWSKEDKAFFERYMRLAPEGHQG